MRSRNVVDSFTYAIAGLLYALASQRNMKVHFALGLLVVILAAVLDVSRLELLILLITVGLVISAEMVNTAIEEVVNMITQEYHPLARVAKNVAAGAVLVTSVISLCVAYVVFIERILAFEETLMRRSFGTPYLTLLALLAVVFLTVVAKVFTGWPTVLRGGMPSGHAAVAFSMATAIFFFGRGLAVILGFLMALLVAQSRVEGEIHNLWEVIIGSLIGVLVTVFFFQLHG